MWKRGWEVSSVKEHLPGKFPELKKIYMEELPKNL
jgi:hypothetical protein